MTRHITLKGVCFSSVVVSLITGRTTSFTFTGCLLVTLSVGLLLWMLYRSFVYPFYFSPLRHVPTVSGRWAGLFSHLPSRISQEMGAAERDWHLKHGSIVRYFILPLGVERLAVADLEAIRDINLRYPYRFAKPQRVINWMKPVLGEKGILLVSVLQLNIATQLIVTYRVGQRRRACPTKKSFKPRFLDVRNTKFGAPVLGERLTATRSTKQRCVTSGRRCISRSTGIFEQNDPGHHWARCICL